MSAGGGKGPDSALGLRLRLRVGLRLRVPPTPRRGPGVRPPFTYQGGQVPQAHPARKRPPQDPDAQLSDPRVQY